MFTGLVQGIGTLSRSEGVSPVRLTIAAALGGADVQLGESIAIDGCCLTVVDSSDGALVFEAATETQERTTLGRLKPGAKVNLERALMADDRLGGHLVLGHV